MLINWRTWRPTVAAFAYLRLFTAEQLELMMCNVNVPVDPAQARAIAAFFREQVLPGRWPRDDCSVDPQVTAALREPQFRDWLERFVAFCESSRGFYVG